MSVAELEANLYDSTANPNDSDGNILEDPCRKLHSIKAPLLKTLTELTMDDLQNHNILGKRDKVDMKAIESLPYDEDGDLATEQGPHCDDEYTHDIYRNYYNTDTLLLSGVQAIMPGTKLILFPEGKGGRRVDLVLEVGDIVVFRGDCWHAGAKYTPSATFASTFM